MREKRIQEGTDPLNGFFFQYIPPVLNTFTKSCISVSASGHTSAVDLDIPTHSWITECSTVFWSKGKTLEL